MVESKLQKFLAKKHRKEPKARETVSQDPSEEPRLAEEQNAEPLFPDAGRKVPITWATPAKNAEKEKERQEKERAAVAAAAEEAERIRLKEEEEEKAEKAKHGEEDEISLLLRTMKKGKSNAAKRTVEKSGPAAPNLVAEFPDLGVARTQPAKPEVTKREMPKPKAAVVPEKKQEKKPAPIVEEKSSVKEEEAPVVDSDPRRLFTLAFIARKLLPVTSSIQIDDDKHKDKYRGKPAFGSPAKLTDNE